jgi:hypothetical protein
MVRCAFDPDRAPSYTLFCGARLERVRGWNDDVKYPRSQFRIGRRGLRGRHGKRRVEPDFGSDRARDARTDRRTDHASDRRTDRASDGRSDRNRDRDARSGRDQRNPAAYVAAAGTGFYLLTGSRNTGTLAVPRGSNLQRIHHDQRPDPGH